MKTLSEVSKLVGLSRRMIQEYESSGLAKTPTTKNKYGHLLYSDDDIDKLWQLRFYKELGYKKGDIEKIFTDKNFNRQESLHNQISLLEKKKEELENLINIAKAMSNIGIVEFSRNLNNSLLNDIPYDLAMSMLGSSLKIINTENDIENLIDQVITEEDVDKWMSNLEKIMELADQGFLPDSLNTQAIVRDMYELTVPVLSPSITMFGYAYIGFMPGSDLSKEIDDVFGKNKSQYLYESIQIFIKNNQDNIFDEELYESVDNILSLGLKKYKTTSLEVQSEVRKLHNSLKKIRLFNFEGQIQLLNAFVELYGSSTYKKIFDKGKERGISWFISRSIQIYVENIEKEAKIND
ncbi:MerR family transcriptional regulator [Clostridium sp. C45]|uniref:MerR family transcriptional regulator n=1 Tax=Clostridium sp. 10cd* TaxID=3373596 RepID=UPI0037C142BE